MIWEGKNLTAKELLRQASIVEKKRREYNDAMLDFSLMEEDARESLWEQGISDDEIDKLFCRLYRLFRL